MRLTAFDKKLQECDITLASLALPAANYVPYVMCGELLFVSGQLPLKDGALMAQGVVGKDVSCDQAIDCAHLCALNLLAWVRHAIHAHEGEGEAQVSCVFLRGYVASAPDFTEQHIVMNGASDLMGRLFAPHGRAAVGVNRLPMDAPIEIEAIFELKKKHDKKVTRQAPNYQTES